MLLSLHVKNFAIIDEAEVYFDNNLNILSGETGAGKSILLGAVNMALGAKASREIIRSNAEYALAELMFVTKSERVRRCMSQMELPMDDDEIIISRKILSSGRSVIKINGESATAGNVKCIADILLDIHGQHEHQSLLSKSRHLEILDEFSGEETIALKKEITERYKEYKHIREEAEGISSDEKKRHNEAGLLTYEINEIESAKLKINEDEELKTEHKRLVNLRVITENLNTAYQMLSGEDGCSDKTGRAIRALSRINEYDKDIEGFLDRVSDIEDSIEDVVRDIAEYADRLEDNSERLSYVEERLDLITRLENKYGNTIDDVLKYAEDCQNRLKVLENYENYKEELDKKLASSQKRLAETSGILSSIRRKNAVVLSGKISEALLELNFNQVRFEIQIEEKEGYHNDGKDMAEFLISLNPGEQLWPLSKVASGGELSRIMLAIKSVLARNDEVETLIFDEIDAGISGRTAQKVSEKLALIATEHQVICITHLPQIAAMADNHFLIEKVSDISSTKTNIRKITRDEIADELARLIGGTEITDSVRKSAAEMKQLAEKKKSEIRSK